VTIPFGIAFGGLLTLSIGSTAAAAAFVAYLSYRGRLSEIERAMELAERLGLGFEKGAGETPKAFARLPGRLRPFLEAFAPWRISGQHRDVPLLIRTEPRSYGKSAKTVLVAVAAYARELSLDFRSEPSEALASLHAALPDAVPESGGVRWECPVSREAYDRIPAALDALAAFASAVDSTSV